MFTAGKAVEVSFERYDPRDVWFPATILEVFGNGSFSVEYQKSNVKDKVTVGSFQIRPCPPHLKNRNFCLLERVDAFYDFGWWSGVITKMLADSRYVVFFKHFNLEKEVSGLELRRHMDWKSGSWYTSQGILIPSDCSVEGDDNCNAKVNQRTVQLDSSGTKDEVSKEKTSCSLNSQGDQIAQSTDCNEKPSNAMVSPNNKPHSLASANDVGTVLQSQVMQKEQDETPCGFDNLTSEGAASRILSMSEYVDQLSGKSTRRKRQKISEQDISVADVQMVQGKQTNLLVDGAQLPIQGKEAAGNVAENNEAGYPIVIGLECISPSRNTRSKTSHHMDGKECSDPLSGQKQHVNDLATNVIEQSEQLRNSESGQKKKRGRPCKSAANTVKSPAPLIDNLQNVDAVDETINKDCTTNESSQTKGQSASESEGRNDEHIEAEEAITEAEAPSNTVDGSNKQATPIDNGAVSSEMPFVKSTILWATIESMDVFQRIPQKPHFQPLEDVKESYREGLAIAYMVTFCSLVDRCSKLQFDDPRSRIEEMLETLAELGEHGFDVEQIEERLKEMVLLKEKHKNLEVQSAEMEVEMVKQEREKTGVDEEIEAMKKQMAELEEKLKVAVTKREAKDVEIACLQSKMDDVRGEITSARSGYQDLASKPLA
ncbi:PREDICTED: DUF724 domain-containing protein 2-like [Ipomoea nil]|uniref:DUF724 domain-containing protein 2-like n=1 Tax=Ipomoea nil TaxID=35883 RepID=UPI0009012D49|nr:PREDICTED: DUF724 domain-containing protein 2-like [Ipomoea nil]